MATDLTSLRRAMEAADKASMALADRTMPMAAGATTAPPKPTPPRYRPPVTRPAMPR